MNPAERLLVVYDVLASTGWPNNATVAHVWATAFEVVPDTPRTDREVTIGLQALHSQTDLVRSALLAEGVPKELASTALDRFDTIASPAYLHSQWASYQGNLVLADTRLSLQWASWILRDHDETELSAEDRDRLISELDTFQADLEVTGMSPFLKAFTLRQIASIRQALRLSKLEGSRPLQQALRTVTGDYKVSEAKLVTDLAVAPEPAQNLIARVSAKLKDVAGIADNLSKVKKVGGEAIELGKAISETVGPYIKDLLT